MTERIRSSDPVKGKFLAGELNTEDRTFIKRVKRAKHYFGLVKGYAIQLTTYNKIKRKADWIKIVEEDTGRELTASIKDWEDHGGIWTGLYGKQRTLSEKYMTVKYGTAAEQGQMPLVS